MPDFIICENHKCPVEDSCYRHLAKPSEHAQSFSVFHPIIDEQGNFVDCDYFKPVIEKKKCKTMGNIVLDEKYLKEVYQDYFIFENSADRTHIVYEITTPDDEPIDFVFDTIEKCKIFIDNLL